MSIGFSFQQWLAEGDYGVKDTALTRWMEANSHYQNKRLHMSNNRKIISRSQGQWVAPSDFRVNAKPFGLWYGIGFSWFKFLLFEYQSAISNFIFQIDINPVKVIFLQTEKEVEEFEERYCPNAEKSVAWGKFDTFAKSKSSYKSYYHGLPGGGYEERKECVFPDWAKIAREFDGIELDPHKVYPAWAKEWAVHSGVIWNKRALVAARLIARYDSTKNHYISL